MFAERIMRNGGDGGFRIEIHGKDSLEASNIVVSTGADTAVPVEIQGAPSQRLSLAHGAADTGGPWRSGSGTTPWPGR